MKGKEKCRMLKQIRKKIADENDIPYVVEECPHQGECEGTCPKCEAELRKLEEELSLRRRIGKKVAVAGLAAGMIVSTTACTPGDIIEVVEELMNPHSYSRNVEGGLVEPPLEGEALPVYEELTGDIAYFPEETGVVPAEDEYFPEETGVVSQEDDDDIPVPVYDNEEE